MGFADFYFGKYKASEKLINQNPNTKLGIVVIIPGFKEENTIEALKSLYFCLPTHCSVEILVLLNYPLIDEILYSSFHERLYVELSNWAKENTTENKSFYILLKPLAGKHAGVGMARKTLMDEAVRRFNVLNKPDGIVVSLDADCTVDSNYLQSIEKIFEENPKSPGCSIYFEHPIQGVEYEDYTYNAIIQYELYLRYYVEALRYAGYPYAYQTVGSAFAVRAEAYVRQGGMNQRKAGEDFYFLNKIIPLGNFKELNDTCIYPSPRESDRVPFGTGAAVTKIIASNAPQYLTYNPDAFQALKQFFTCAPKFFQASEDQIKEYIEKLLPTICRFLINNDIQKSLKEFNSNCASLQPFLKRFYNWFNGLMVLQYLNECHVADFEKIPVSEAASTLLLEFRNYKSTNDPKELLDTYRALQKTN